MKSISEEKGEKGVNLTSLELVLALAVAFLLGLLAPARDRREQFRARRMGISKLKALIVERKTSAVWGLLTIVYAPTLFIFLEIPLWGVYWVWRAVGSPAFRIVGYAIFVGILLIILPTQLLSELRGSVSPSWVGTLGHIMILFAFLVGAYVDLDSVKLIESLPEAFSKVPSAIRGNKDQS